MLVLTRKVEQSIDIGDVRITVFRIKGNQVRIGIDAPKSVSITRSETSKKTLTSEEVQAAVDRLRVAQ